MIRYVLSLGSILSIELQKVVQENGATFLKLECKGHGECPSQEIVSTFIGIAEKFIQNNPLDIIGIHCTHGFNRTGFLIGTYRFFRAR